MKEFDGWWKKQGSRILNLSISMDNPGGKTYKEGTKDGWESALKWVLIANNTANYPDEKGCLIDIIKEELEG